jgi:predicted HAD superfamily phosphohydrolase YqeG
MRDSYERLTGLRAAIQRAGQLAARTLIIDVEPLIAPWDTPQALLEEGIAWALARAAELPSVQAVCFATNSARRPSRSPHHPGVQVTYIASARKPLRTAHYRHLPRPLVVIGDQIATDGALARRLGAAFLRSDLPTGTVPPGPRFMAGLGTLVRPLLFGRPRRPGQFTPAG